MRKTSRRVAIYGGCLAALAIAFLAGGTWAGLDGKAAVFDGIVESTFGGFMFPDGSVQTSASQTGAALKVRDSLGVELGAVYGWSWWAGEVNAYFLLDYDGSKVFMFLTGEDRLQLQWFHGPAGRYVYYDQPGCTGSTYMAEEILEEPWRAPSTIYVIGYGDILYRTFKEKTGFVVNAPSRSNSRTSCEAGDPVWVLDNQLFAEEAIDMSSEFTPPFTID